MSSDFQPFQPRSEFLRTETAPQTYALVALNGADTLRCHNVSPAALSALREIFGQEMRLYGENAESQVAEFVLRSGPWSAKSARSETLITNIFTVLLLHQYTFLTTIDYGRQYLDKLSLTFTRPTSLSTPAPASQSIFALLFTAPTVLRVLNAPLHATPAILQSVRGTWPRGVKGERKLGGGSWEFRLKGFGYFSTEKSDESILPHVFTLLRALDAHAFRLVAAIPIDGRSRSKDLWIFTAPGVSSTGSGSVAGSMGVGTSNTTSPYQATMDSEWTYTSGPETASPVTGHGKFATDEPARGEFGMGAGMAGIGAGNGSKGHRRSSSAPVAAGGSKGRKPVPALTPPRGSPSQSPGLKATPPPAPGVRGSPVTKASPMPSPMVMPVPTIPPPLSPTQSPAQPSTPLGSSPTMVPVPIPPQKRNSSLLKKFREGGGSGRTASGRFNHPPPPPTVRNGNGSPPNGIPLNSPNGAGVNEIGVGILERKRMLVLGGVIYETPAPPSSGSPTPNAGASFTIPLSPPALGVAGSEVLSSTTPITTGTYRYQFAT
ncbi:hypothetical protein BDV93DRAFT_612000 [Ceratobasidium sp. AG-I]|nr:hypothetical protein BDV93DRAFT_612000 [Ceratobasidium sp. AG-I]